MFLLCENESDSNWIDCNFQVQIDFELNYISSQTGWRFWCAQIFVRRPCYFGRKVYPWIKTLKGIHDSFVLMKCKSNTRYAIIDCFITTALHVSILFSFISGFGWDYTSTKITLLVSNCDDFKRLFHVSVGIQFLILIRVYLYLKA